MSQEKLSIENRIKNSKKKLDEFYRTRFMTVLDILIAFTNLKVSYSGKDTALKLQEMISLQKYYKVRLNKLKALQEELNLYSDVLENNNDTLDVLHLKLANKNISIIESELCELMKEIDGMIEEYTQYTKTAIKDK